MELCCVNELVENANLLRAKNDRVTRDKWLEKLRLPDDSACKKSRKRLQMRWKTSSASRYNSTKAELDHFSRLTEIEPIGRKLFNQFSSIHTRAEIRQSWNFVQDVSCFQRLPSNEQKGPLSLIAASYFNQNSPQELFYIPSVSKALFISYLFNGCLPSRSEIQRAIWAHDVLTEDISSDEDWDLASNSSKLSDDEDSLRYISIALIQCKKMAKFYLMECAFDLYQESEYFQTYLKWKHLESEPVSDECFTLFRILGRGGFGEVYACQVNLTGKMYACKRYNKVRIKKQRADKTVMVEKAILEKVNCRFVVNLAYAYQTKTDLVLVMTLMDGGDLKYHIYDHGASHGVSKDQCQFYSAQISLALQFLHKENIIYRDLKPENVLLDWAGNCRIADFGLACVKKGEEEKTSSRAGTLGYMAPEVLQFKPYSFGADWFSLGCTMFEMCEGKNPFIALQKGRKRIDRDLTIENTLSTSFQFHRFHSPYLTDIIHHLLQKYVEDRLDNDNRFCPGLQNHIYFSNVNWGRLKEGLVQPPFVPSKNHIYAKDSYDIRLFSDVTSAVTINRKDKEKYKAFATGRNPIIWQQEVLETGIFEEIMRKRTAEKNNVSNSSSIICVLL